MKTPFLLLLSMVARVAHPGAPAIWLKLGRNGELFTVYSSIDWTTWHAIATRLATGSARKPSIFPFADHQPPNLTS